MLCEVEFWSAFALFDYAEHIEYDYQILSARINLDNVSNDTESVFYELRRVLLYASNSISDFDLELFSDDVYALIILVQRGVPVAVIKYIQLINTIISSQ